MVLFFLLASLLANASLWSVVFRGYRIGVNGWGMASVLNSLVFIFSALWVADLSQGIDQFALLTMFSEAIVVIVKALWVITGMISLPTFRVRKVSDRTVVASAVSMDPEVYFFGDALGAKMEKDPLGFEWPEGTEAEMLDRDGAT